MAEGRNIKGQAIFACTVQAYLWVLRIPLGADLCFRRGEVINSRFSFNMNHMNRNFECPLKGLEAAILKFGPAIDMPF